MSIQVIDFDQPYSLHQACGVSNETSIAIIGQLNTQELEFLKNIDFAFFNTGWPSRMDEKDYELNAIFPIDLEQAVKEDDFVLFGSIDSDKKTDRKTFKEIFSSRFPELEHHNSDMGGFSSYFAHIHEDSGNSDVRAQINVIIDNPLGHALISQSADGQYHKVIPKKGDIILLDIHCHHAIIPNQSKGFKKMRENPIIAGYIS